MSGFAEEERRELIRDELLVFSYRHAPTDSPGCNTLDAAILHAD